MPGAFLLALGLCAGGALAQVDSASVKTSDGAAQQPRLVVTTCTGPRHASIRSSSDR